MDAVAAMLNRKPEELVAEEASFAAMDAFVWMPNQTR
jgi:hypothetical protein